MSTKNAALWSLVISCLIGLILFFISPFTLAYLPVTFALVFIFIFVTNYVVSKIQTGNKNVRIIIMIPVLLVISWYAYKIVSTL